MLGAWKEKRFITKWEKTKGGEKATRVGCKGIEEQANRTNKGRSKEYDKRKQGTGNERFFLRTISRHEVLLERTQNG